VGRPPLPPSLSRSRPDGRFNPRAPPRAGHMPSPLLSNTRGPATQPGAPTPMARGPRLWGTHVLSSGNLSLFPPAPSRPPLATPSVSQCSRMTSPTGPSGELYFVSVALSLLFPPSCPLRGDSRLPPVLCKCRASAPVLPSPLSPCSSLMARQIGSAPGCHRPHARPPPASSPPCPLYRSPPVSH